MTAERSIGPMTYREFLDDTKAKAKEAFAQIVKDGPPKSGPAQEYMYGFALMVAFMAGRTYECAVQGERNLEQVGGTPQGKLRAP